jgi:hypothetical protein
VAGGAYWESKYRAGETDGRGHITTPSVVQQKPTKAPPRQKPPAQPRSYKTPGTTPTRVKSPRLAQQAAAVRRAHAEGKIGTVEARDRLGPKAASDAAPRDHP